MIKYTKNMIHSAAEMNADVSELYPSFSGRKRTYLVNTVIDLNLEQRDMGMILLFDEQGDMKQISTSYNPNAPLERQYKRMLTKMGRILISKNKEILKNNSDPEGFYILWAADQFFEIRYFTKEEIALHGRIYHIQGRGKLKVATNQINETGYIANIIAALLVLIIISIFFIAFAMKVKL